ncbi:MAG: dihydroneopterin aldolase [Bacteroidales bacterium]|nr:dihydroneopterin aldolase [Bacteroidales bacterium]
MDYIALNDMRFYGFHGCLPQERKTGGYYVVHLKLYMDLQPAGRSDRLEDTVDYAEVYERIKAIMQQPVNLIEHLAERICTDLRERYIQVRQIDIRIVKQHPPISGEMGSSEVFLSR